MRKNIYRDQVVIVTGASAGIGKALALRLASQGAKLAIAARRADRLAQVAAECQRLGGQAVAIPTDVSDEVQCKNLVTQTIEAFGRLDMLICNAGLAVISLFADYPDLTLFKHVMNVNFYGAVYCAYAALPYLKQTKGRIVAISSLGGKTALPYNTPYTSSKYAMHGFFDALRMELAQDGVSVTLICPYWVVTEFHEAQMTKDGVAIGPRGRATYTKKMMSAEHCAEITLNAAHKRRREVLMNPGPLVVWLKLIAPGWLDWLAVKVILKPVARRVKAARENKPEG